MTLLRSGMCRQEQLESEVFQVWAARMGAIPGHMHRKNWEWCFISQALAERDMLRPGHRGLGFAVGQEPLPALFASLGCEVVATDLETEEARAGGWVEGNMHAGSLVALARPGICDRTAFDRRVRFRFADMRALPDDLGTFDFLWSSCSLEHLGTLAQGERFVHEALRFLKPGGVAVHTTEFNVSSNDETIGEGQTNLYRRRDLERLAGELRRRGYGVDLDFTAGDLPCDSEIDVPPYRHHVHLKLLLGGYVVTSYGLIIESANGEAANG